MGRGISASCLALACVHSMGPFKFSFRAGIHHILEDDDGTFRDFDLGDTEVIVAWPQFDCEEFFSSKIYKLGYSALLKASMKGLFIIVLLTRLYLARATGILIFLYLHEDLVQRGHSGKNESP